MANVETMYTQFVQGSGFIATRQQQLGEARRLWSGRRVATDYLTAELVLLGNFAAAWGDVQGLLYVVRLEEQGYKPKSKTAGEIADLLEKSRVLARAWVDLDKQSRMSLYFTNRAALGVTAGSAEIKHLGAAFAAGIQWSAAEPPLSAMFKIADKSGPEEELHAAFDFHSFRGCGLKFIRG